MQNQARPAGNGYRHGDRGAAAKGRALLQGIVYCGRCGARMAVFYYSTKEKRAPGYGCVYAYSRHGGATCQMMSSAAVDAAVTELFLGAVSPAKLEIALHALEELEADRAEARKQWELQIAAAPSTRSELAQRRYEAADPANRLVAAELEAQWEEALRQREAAAREQASEFERRQEQPPGGGGAAADQGNRQRPGAGVAGGRRRPWRTAKTLLRFLVRRVHLDGVT